MRIKIGNVLVRQHKYRDALDEYHLASKAAEQAASARRVVDWQIKLSVALEQAADFLASLILGSDLSDDQPASSTGNDALLYYQTALEAVAAAASKEPDNPVVRSRRAAITAKIETQKSAAQ